MEDKPTAKPPEGVDLEKALAEFSDNMRKLNDKVRQVTEEINAFQEKAKRPAHLNRQSFRAVQRNRRKKERQGRHYKKRR